MKIRIAYCISTLARSGPVNVLYDLVQYVDHSRFEITVISLSDELADSRIGDFQKLDCHLVNLHGPRGICGIYQNYRALSQWLRHNPQDIIHAHCLRSLFNVALLSNRQAIQKIATIHNNLLEFSIIQFGPLKGNLIALLQFLLLRRCDLTITCSQTLEQELKKYLKKNITISNGIDLNAFLPATTEQKRHIRSFLNLPEHLILFVSISRIAPGKNIDQLLDVFSRLPNSCRLLVLGDGELLDGFRRKYQNLETIEFCGPTAFVSNYLQAADCFLSASRSEGMPCAVLEALACGIPVILSDISQHGEILKGTESVGLLFPQNDTEALERLIRSFLTGEEKLYGSAARRLAVQRLSSAQMSQSYETAYNMLLNNK